MRFMIKVCLKLIKRAWVHDFSKYSKDEAPYFAAAANTKDVVYGSEEYKRDVEVNLKPALEHHYKLNSHHPQHFENGIKEMNPLDKIEMLVDWKASTLRNKDGDIRKSLELNRKRYKYTVQEMKNFEKFYKEIKSW